MSLRTMNLAAPLLLGLALAGPPGAARAANEPSQAPQPDVQQLERRVQELSASVTALREQLERNGTPAPAEEAATQDDVSGVRGDLENFKYQYGREREYNTALTNRPVNFSAVVQARFGYVDRAAPTATVANNGTKSTFTTGAAALQFFGNLYKDYEAGRNLTYLLRAGAIPNGGVNLQFANLTYNLRRTLSPEDSRLTVTVGQQILPFGLDVAAVDELKPTINTAQFASLFPNAIDVGASVKGEVAVQYDYGFSYRAPLLTWQAAVVNGSGANRQDDNEKKDVFGRVVFTVPADYHGLLRQLAFGVSGYRGWQNTTVVDPATRAPVLSGIGRRDRVGFDIYYNHHPFGVTYEFVRGWDGRTFGTAAAPGLETVTSQGHVATIYYTFGNQFLYGFSALGTASLSQARYDDWWPKSVQPFARVDLWDPSVGKHDAQRGWQKEAYTAGVNVFFAQTTKLQLNVNYVKDRSPTAPDTFQALGQLQFGF